MLAEFFLCRGIDAVMQDDILWYAVRPGLYQCLPCHRGPEQLASRIEHLFRHRRVLAARFTTLEPLNEGAATTGVVYVRTGPFDIARLSANTRSKVRRGLRHCTVSRVDPSELAERGIALSMSTAQRQGMTFRGSQVEDWRRLCSAASRSPVLEAWEARVAHDPAALAICFRLGEAYYVSNVCSAASHLGAYPNNALLATLLDEVLARSDIEIVCYGMGSLDPSQNGLHQFKTSMGFAALPVYDNVVTRMARVVQALRPAVNLVAARHGSHRLQQFSGALDRVQSRGSIRADIRSWT